ncbi:site-2 protease family protein [Streptomyces sp. NA04227]|uniref:site-2 protease family protein n=1 Tax=Streptomyces sp. NA04227 TaxID=2742136 RepID=UPI001590A2ED|nr:site-2 protease family protein [Streptomyces sp. NA04227]QKW05635.1 site-2 protease family protein [Streptomyces sp. NA04227]
MDESGQPYTGGRGADDRDGPTESDGSDTASAGSAPDPRTTPPADGPAPTGAPTPPADAPDAPAEQSRDETVRAEPAPAEPTDSGSGGANGARDAKADVKKTDAEKADAEKAHVAEAEHGNEAENGNGNGTAKQAEAEKAAAEQTRAEQTRAEKFATEKTGTEKTGTEKTDAEKTDTEKPGADAPYGTGQPPHPTPQHPAPPTHPAPSAHDARKPGRTRAQSGSGGRIPPRRPEPGGGILMGRPFGVPVYVAPSWFLVAVLITWVFGDQLERVLPELGNARYLVSLFFAVAFYASVLVHELAHTVAALRFELPVRRIQLQFFGGVSEIEKESETPGREFVLAFVGPLLSLVLAGVFYLGMLTVESDTVPGVLLAGLMISNLLVAAFNLLPGLPLDGGRMLRAVIWKLTGNPMSGTVAAAWVGRALAVSVLIGLPLLTQYGGVGGETDFGGWNTLTDALLAAILAGIIWTGAGNSLRMARLREHLPELRARTLTRRAVPVEYATPLSEALRRANESGARALVVVDPGGEPRALVREAAIVGVPQHRRPWVAVGTLAQDITEGMLVSAELAGEELLDVLRATPASEYLVVEESGEIFGVLSAADVERAFVKAMARPN